VAPIATPLSIKTIAAASERVSGSPRQSVAVTALTPGVPDRPRDVLPRGQRLSSRMRMWDDRSVACPAFRDARDRGAVTRRRDRRLPRTRWKVWLRGQASGPVAVRLAALVGVAVALVVGPGGRAPAAARWLVLAPMQEPRQEVGVAGLDGRIYVAGGFGAAASPVATVEAYDVAAGQWSFVAPLPLPLDHPAAAAVGGKLYVLGGFLNGTAQDGTLEYDPATDRWTARAPMPSARGALAAAVIDGKIYAVGGARTQGSVGDLAIYDPAQDRWQSLAPMPTGRDHLGAGAIAGRLYAAGGRNQVSFILDVLEVFDPATGVWTRKAPMPTGRSGVAAAVAGGRLFVLGGEGNAADPLGIFRQVEAYDPLSDTWTAEPSMLTPRHGIGAALQGADIHVPGGATMLGFGVTGVHEAFRVESATTIIVTLAGCRACAPGDRFVVEVSAANGTTAPLPVEVKVGVRDPGGNPLSVLADRHLELTLPRGETGPLRVIDLVVPAGLPAGSWRVEGALLEPALGETLAREARPFTVVP
jgi:N-acetylneuraminic acid mutarotase